MTAIATSPLMHIWAKFAAGSSGHETRSECSPDAPPPPPPCWPAPRAPWWRRRSLPPAARGRTCAREPVQYTRKLKKAIPQRRSRKPCLRVMRTDGVADHHDPEGAVAAIRIMRSFASPTNTRHRFPRDCGERTKTQARKGRTLRQCSPSYASPGWLAVPARPPCPVPHAHTQPPAALREALIHAIKSGFMHSKSGGPSLGSRCGVSRADSSGAPQRKHVRSQKDS